MKRTINYSWILSLLLLVLVVIPVSCSKDNAKENPQSETNLPLIKISGEHSLETTKTTLNGVVTTWVATTDKVGIFAPSSRTQTGGVGDPVVNSEFAAASSGPKSSFIGTMYWGVPSASHTFYAYYPYAPGSPAATAVSVLLPAAQTQSAANSTAHIGALDFLVATPVTVTSPGNTNSVANDVNLSYNHLFTVLEFQIKGTGQLKAVKLSANRTLAFSIGTVDITQATPAAGAAYTIVTISSGRSNEVVVTLTTPATLTATNADTKVYMVINPVIPTGSCLIELSVDGTNWTHLFKEAPVNGFKRGFKYVVSVDASSASTVEVGEVISVTGRVWMDRNLGASRVATSFDDDQAYGDIYQWGRGSDGHQLRTSGHSYSAVDTDNPGHSDFILVASGGWRIPQNDNLWQGRSGTNNPCPSGFRLPTEAEFNEERSTWSISNYLGAFASPLKLPAGGERYGYNGLFYTVGTTGRYWSSTVDETGSRRMSFNNFVSNINTGSRAYGHSVRCIKN